MSKLTVTLNAIRAHEPCAESWQKLLTSLKKTKADDQAVSLTYILDLLGLDDALWVLRALPESMDDNVRLLVCDLAEPALQDTTDPRPAEAVAVARRYARGEASPEELSAAWDAAWDAAQDLAAAGKWDAASGAAWTAASASESPAESAAGRDAAWDAVRTKQEAILRDWIQSLENELCAREGESTVYEAMAKSHPSLERLPRRLT